MKEKESELEMLRRLLIHQVNANSALTFQIKKMEKRIAELEKSDLPSDFYDLYCRGRKGAIDYKQMSTRAINTLKYSSGIRTYEDFVGKSEKDLLKIKNFGNGTMEELKAMLASDEPVKPPLHPISFNALVRYGDVLNMRNSGATFQNIADKYHVSRARAHALYKTAISKFWETKK